MKIFKAISSQSFTQSLLLLAALSGLGATGCKEGNIKSYVEEAVKVDLHAGSGNVARGSLDFIETRYETHYQNVCDTVVCGYDSIQRCTPGHTVCNGGGSPVCYTDPRGHRVCNGGGPRSCHYVPGTCYFERIPRYCRVNCRQEPYTTSREVRHTSPVVVTLRGLDAASVKDLSLTLGFKTNSRFVGALRDPSLRPKKLGFLFDSLNERQRTLALLKAPGYALVPQQDFFNLRPDFRPGDAIEIDLQVVRAQPNLGDLTFSVTGSEQDVPALRYVGRP